MSTTAKPAKTKTVVLRLSPEALSKFPSATPSQSSKPNSSPPETAPQIVLEPPSADAPADSTPAVEGPSTPSSLAPPATDAGSKRKGPKPAVKRNAAAMEGTPKARGRPGPKKKQKLGDMINDPNNKSPFAAATPLAKLGPKANQGAINAGLRALDRTGKFKCRKWEKKGFQLRSFTGVVWEAPSWRAPNRGDAFSEDVKSDTTGSSDPKVKDESSAVSDKSGAIGDRTSLPPLNHATTNSQILPATPS
ncbi:hypothetical protein P153DRAFT_387065 [Dothidotthia symphoricarpi CBS 119687]|uniref:DUF1711-domain-containing protein n=1 Tax=Dothidotthia symphoricarpi CBS 119687 TaxID=1392245 RepID=A0A6A6A7Y8_9PLEO|nr:uncharacterized protein P153DRAFT_387065 [Dothidotthia symphoricarpi CBS 119687]KAF2128102.1 hypothetical protein P153DRAFT_387065 [Dothidotthia symphoricarpi CBS 119687]